MSGPPLDEEARGLLAQVLERLGYRQLMAANIRGHGLKLLPEPADKRRLAADLAHALEVLERVQALYSALGGDELWRAVRGKLERIPYPESRMELGVCLATCDLAERVAMESYVGSLSQELSDIAHSILGASRAATEAGEETFVAFARAAAQRPHARQLFDRWVTIAVLSLGRPGTARDRRARELGLRRRSCAESIGLYLERLAPFREACGLELPDLAASGVVLPA